jgi:hypothetical protein
MMKLMADANRNGVGDKTARAFNLAAGMANMEAVFLCQ